MVSSSGHLIDSSTEYVRTIDTDETIQKLLNALEDADSRAILAATSNETLSANEVSQTCELPLSTTYRKLELLTETGLLEERTRIRRSGKHASEYSRLINDVIISLSSDGEMELQVSQRKDPDQVASSIPAMEE